jgi:hypothetical protein
MVEVEVEEVVVMVAVVEAALVDVIVIVVDVEVPGVTDQLSHVLILDTPAEDWFNPVQVNCEVSAVM